MADNSFATPDGGHVTGTVAMGIDERGNAVPVDIRPITLDQFCRALAAHAAIVVGRVEDREVIAVAIASFARKGTP